MLLHGLVPPTKCAKNNEKSVWKFSIADSQESFMSFYNTLDAREESVSNFIEKNKQYSVKTNLYLTAIGESLDKAKFQVSFDEITHEYPNILEAIEFAFKVIDVFNLSYQSQSVNFWQLLEGCLWNKNVDGKIPTTIKNHIDNIKKNMYCNTNTSIME